MPPSWRGRLGVLLAMAIVVPACAQSTQRILYAYAPTASDPALLQQRRVLTRETAGMAERDLVLIPVIGKRPTFEVVLVGKDGGEKLRSSEPLAPQRLFAIIDAMPMRRQESRSQR